MGRYQKFLAALFSAALVSVHVVANRGGPLTYTDWLTIVDAVGGAVLVYLIPNSPPAKVPTTPA